jgi:hypothetical protein
MAGRLVVFFLLLASFGVHAPATRPQVEAFFSSVFEGASFFVECQNDTGRAVPEEAWPAVLRIDGQPLAEGVRATITHGTLVEPGNKWRAIIELRQKSGPGAAAKLGASMRVTRLVAFSQGRHTFAVRCSDAWSEDFAFYWEDRAF